MPTPKRAPKLVPIYLRRKDGIIQKYYIRGRNRAINHPQRPSANEIRRFRRQQNRQKPQSVPPPPHPEPTQPRVPSEPPRAGQRRRRGVGEPPFGVVEERRGAVYSTWFRATGSGLGYRIDDESLMDNGDKYLRFVEALRERLPGEFNVPMAFSSNHPEILGQVKWEGVVHLDLLIDELNIQLQAYGSEVPGFDFRGVYPVWQYKYTVVETVGGVDKEVFVMEGHS